MHPQFATEPLLTFSCEHFQDGGPDPANLRRGVQNLQEPGGRGHRLHRKVTFSYLKYFLLNGSEIFVNNNMYLK